MKLPDGWIKTRLEKVATVQTGIAKNQMHIAENLEVPYLRVANVQDGFLDLSEIKMIRVKKDKIDRYKLQIGDVLLTEGGDFDKLGRGTVWPGGIENCVHQNHVFVVRPDNKSITSDFLSAQTGSSYGKKYFLSCSKQSTNLASINSSQLKAFPTILPPFSEQKAIIEILSFWDETIEKNEKLIAVKERLFKGLLDKLIYWSNKIGGWKEIRTEEVFRERRETNSGDLPLLSITGKEGVIPREATNRKDTSNSDKSKYLRICPGDIGYNTMRMWQGVSALSNLEGIVSPAYTICIPNEKLYPPFAAYLFKTPFMIHRFYRYSQGLTSDTWNLKFRHFKEVSMPIPKINTQRQIAKTLKTAQQEIDLLKQLNEKYKMQKRGLMQKLLTGEWRIKPEIVNKYKES
ncbi:MAG: restriction endonuclease subunit S [Deltaproteobacteria bacterium]|jgi:type I restriction enzyme S subunit|nr:restriction endonuclease subunit S [Deltaproteobacteria bacterium]